jgi:hypothetical protein
MDVVRRERRNAGTIGGIGPGQEGLSRDCHQAFIYVRPTAVAGTIVKANVPERARVAVVHRGEAPHAGGQRAVLEPRGLRG